MQAGKRTYPYTNIGLYINMMKELSTLRTELFNLNFQSLEAVYRYRDPQLRVTGNLCGLRNLGPNIYQCFRI